MDDILRVAKETGVKIVDDSVNAGKVKMGDEFHDLKDFFIDAFAVLEKDNKVKGDGKND